MLRIASGAAIVLSILVAFLLPPIALAEEKNPGGPEHADHREEYIKRLMYEGELMNQRLNWLLASQTLLFAGYGAVLNASIRKSVKERIAKVAVVLGVTSALLILVGIIAAIGASITLIEAGLANKPGFPKYEIWAWTNLTGWLVALFLPALFFGSWVMLPTQELDSELSPGGLERSRGDRGGGRGH